MHRRCMRGGGISKREPHSPPPQKKVKHEPDSKLTPLRLAMIRKQESLRDPDADPEEILGLTAAFE